MIPRLVEVATGVDLVDSTVARAAGASQPVRLTPSRSAAISFVLADRSGVFDSLTGLTDVLRQPGVVDVGSLRLSGRSVDHDRSFQDRVGYVVTRGSEGADAAALAQRVVDDIGVRTV